MVECRGWGSSELNLERRGKTVKWLRRAFIFSLQLCSSNLDFQSKPLITTPHTQWNTHAHVSVFQIRMVPRVCCRVVQWGPHVSIFCILAASYAECPERKHEAKSWIWEVLYEGSLLKLPSSIIRQRHIKRPIQPSGSWPLWGKSVNTHTLLAVCKMNHGSQRLLLFSNPTEIQAKYP